MTQMVFADMAVGQRFYGSSNKNPDLTAIWEKINDEKARAVSHPNYKPGDITPVYARKTWMFYLVEPFEEVIP